MQPISKKDSETEFADENFAKATEDKNEQQQSEIRCGACGKAYYIDKEMADYYNRLIERDLDNPFLCDDCLVNLQESITQDR